MFERQVFGNSKTHLPDKEIPADVPLFMVGSQSRLMSFSEMGNFSRITSRDENSHET